MKRQIVMNRRLRRPGGTRRGFTLVELLVAVALVVLMMTMFAEIFALASNAVSTQRGAAANDQKVRTFTTLLQGDIAGRTFRDVMPFQVSAGQEGAFDNTGFSGDLKMRRKGYFSISENDPNDPTDDVLSFTVDVDTQYGYEGAQLFGRTAPASDKGVDAANPNGYPDNPENDDGLALDQRGASTMAEVAYFLRNGNLYRSVMLVREPYALDPPPPANTGTFVDDQPSYGGVPLFTASEDQFWAKFDYSAFRHPTTGVVTFHSVNSLNNDRGSTGTFTLPDGVTQVPPSLGIPHLRFGHTINGYSGTGQPDEYTQDPTNPPTNVRFIGRPLKQELADTTPAFYPYPGTGDPATSPMAAGTWDATSGLVAPYNGTIDRRGAELLLPNVHEFDVQVWDDDPRLPAPMWTDVGALRDVDSDGDGNVDDDGDGFAEGFYDGGNCRNTVYCPPNRYRFDTWHPSLLESATVPQTTGPPFRGVWPDNPAAAPAMTSPDGKPGRAANATFDGDDDKVNGADDAGEIGWIGSDDERPLRQIRVRVRFYDVNSGQLRQLTLTLPLTDNGGTL